MAPIVWVSYGAPAFKTGGVETAVMQLLSELLASQAAPLYKKLRYEKQLASNFNVGANESFDPRALTASAQLYKNKYTEGGQAYSDEVINEIIAGMDDLKTFSKQKNARQLLDTLKSKYRYDFLAAMSSPANIAQNFAWYYRFDRDAEVFERLLQSVDKLTPKDIDAFARKYFAPENRVVLTLAYQPKAQASGEEK